MKRYFEGLCKFFLLRIGMIDNMGRFKDDVGIVIFGCFMSATWNSIFKKTARNESILRRSCL